MIRLIVQLALEVGAPALWVITIATSALVLWFLNEKPTNQKERTK